MNGPRELGETVRGQGLVREDRAGAGDEPHHGATRRETGEERARPLDGVVGEPEHVRVALVG